MSPTAKSEYLRAIYYRYKEASTRQQKSAILHEFCLTCGYHRKHAIRLLRLQPHLKPKNKPRGRTSIYRIPTILAPLKKIWLSANLPCAKRLKAIIPLWLPGYECSFGALKNDIRLRLLRMSHATIDRLLTPVRLKHTRHGKSSTKPGTLLKKQIPIKTNQWDESRPGFLEADTVAHCGSSLLGEFIYSIDAVDIATGWTEQRATWGKGEAGVLAQIKDIEGSLPFALLGFDSDNGSEFMNYHLLRHFHDRKTPIQFTRSRAYYKNDNAHIEQKNWTHIRQWLGYDRLENPALVPLLNELFTSEWRLFHNFFCPSVKLIQKNRIGSKTFKRYDDPKTPYQRVLDSPYISDEQKHKLTSIFSSLNPFQLRQAIEAKIKRIFAQR